MPAPSLSLITKQSAAAMGLSAGSPVCVLFKAAAVHVIRCEGRTSDVGRERGTVVSCGADIPTYGSFCIG
ncbi:MAG: TOBE domain-containing protein [Euryarchaeota archaeon]|nr:TOBE domain-containing protein [Euryarchaeota archaeon]